MPKKKAATTDTTTGTPEAQGPLAPEAGHVYTGSAPLRLAAASGAPGAIPTTLATTLRAGDALPADFASGVPESARADFSAPPA